MSCRTGSRSRSGFWVRIAFAALLLAPPFPAWAHHQAIAKEASADGISIPNITHGQMPIIADNKAAILNLAERQTPTDPITRRLELYIDLQFFACMWGIIPGSLGDEDSPFNECTHAYLAATRALLLHLQETSGSNQATLRALVAKIEREMLGNSASLIACRYSDEPFNTAELVGPHWSNIPYHLPSLMTFVALAMTTVGGAWMTVRWKSRLR